MQATEKRALSALDRPVLAAVFTAAIYAVFIYLWLLASGYDASVFVQAGDRLTDPAAVSIHVLPNSLGYDGQAYYRLALDPFTSRQDAYGIHLDNPPYRQQRILYPLLGWILSFGHAAALPVVLRALSELYMFSTLAVAGGRPSALSWRLYAYSFPLWILEFLRT